VRAVDARADARPEPEQVGRGVPLSAEKLSPILAFYAAPNLRGHRGLRRLLEFGGLGHTCSIHSQIAPHTRVRLGDARVRGS